MQSEQSIGVFDSGVGGLTVLHALEQALPQESFVYLGDTARVPYGTRSAATILRYSNRVAGHLLARNVKAIVIACNTATSYALESLQLACSHLDIPVYGVIEPSASVAVERTSDAGSILVMGTEGTITGGKYTECIHARSPNTTVIGLPCPLFVPLIEEGWHQHTVSKMVAQEYLNSIEQIEQVETAILGCTHYPLLRPTLEELYPKITFIDSAQTTAEKVAADLRKTGRLRSMSMAQEALESTEHSETPLELQNISEKDQKIFRKNRTLFLVTDNLQRFQQVGTLFMGYTPSPIELVDLTEEDENRITQLL